MPSWWSGSGWIPGRPELDRRERERKQIASMDHEALYRKNQTVVFSYISARVSSREDAEDLCRNAPPSLQKLSSGLTFIFDSGYNTIKPVRRRIP